MDDRNPALAELEPLVGEWEMEAVFPGEPPTTVRGRVAVAWAAGGAFLEVRSEAESAGPPSSVAMVGRDDAGNDYTVLYADERGVSRVYGMSFGEGVWRQWRDAPGFAQRFTGRLAADGQTIEAAWETAVDGRTWTHDFDLTFRRRR